jgi:hypothetical protein
VPAAIASSSDAPVATIINLRRMDPFLLDVIKTASA